MAEYIHKYTDKEAERLYDQALILEPYIHKNIEYRSGEVVLEAGCGVGAQSVILAKNNPDTEFVSIDCNSNSIDRAKNVANEYKLSNIEFHTADILKLPFEAEMFDHIFICFVLEHLKSPKEALVKLKRVLKKCGTITIIEGYGKSEHYFPVTPESKAVWDSYFELHTSGGGNPFMGQDIHDLLFDAGFSDIKTQPIEVRADKNNRALKENLLLKLILPAFDGIKEAVMDKNLIDGDTWEKGMRDFKDIIRNDNGFFSYSWFQAIAKK